jgi:ABC-2 type transport system permease protein
LLDQPTVITTTFKLLLGVNILISMVIGSTMVSGEKERGTLESLLLTPLTKRKIIKGKLLAILVFWFILSLVALPYLVVLSYGTDMLPMILFYLYVIGTLLVIAFSSVALILSTLLSSTKNAMILALLFFLITVMPMFLSTMIKKTGFGKIINDMSPIASSMKGLKEIFVNKVGMSQVFIGMIPTFVFFVITILVALFVSKKVDFLRGE